MKKNKYLIMSFIIPILILLVFYAYRGIVPFGNKSLVLLDGISQYLPMTFGILKHNISFYQVGIGGSIISILFTYLSSPFNILSIIFNNHHMDLYFSFLFMIKVASASLTMNYYLKEKFNNNSYGFVVLSVLYSLCGYTQGYGFNFMWQDALVILPLIILGIERIKEKNNYKLYFISLITLLFANYYISYMVIIFSGIYAFFYFIKDLKMKEIKNTFFKYLKFIGVTILSLLVMAFVIYPLLKNATSNSASELMYIPNENYIFKVDKSAFLASYFSFMKIYDFNSTNLVFPNFSCGILSVFLIICYIFNKKINKNEKIFYLLITLFMFACFFEFGFDYIMNCFHFPNSLPYRYAFLYSFIIISISASSYNYLKNISTKFKIITIFLIELIMLILIKDITIKIIIANSILLFAYLLSNYKFKPLLILIVCIELVITCSLNIPTNYLNTYHDNYESIIKNNKTNNRIEIISERNNNLGLLYNYHGINSYSSTNKNTLYEFLFSLGINGNNYNLINYSKYNHTDFLTMLLNIDYLIDKGTIIKSKYKSSYMFGVNDDVKKFIFKKDSFENQQMLAKYMTNEDILRKVSYELNLIEVKDNLYLYEIIFDDLDDCYLVKYPYNFIALQSEDYIVYRNKSIEKFDLKYEERVHYLDLNIAKLKNKALLITYEELNEDLELYKYELDDFYNCIKDNMLKDISINGNTLEGNINLKSDMTIFTSIAYDDGFTLYVDGKKHDYYDFNDSLLMFDLESGKHHIKLVHKEKNLIKGIYISLFTLIGIIFYMAFRNKLLKK